MAQFCEDIKCKFYDSFPDGQKFPFCPFCSKPLVAEKPSLQTKTFCQNRECTFYNSFPNGGEDGFKCCPFCQGPVVTKKPLLRDTEKPLHRATDPQPVDQPTEREESFVEIESCSNVASNQFFAPIYNWRATKHGKNLESRHDIKFENVSVTFSTAVLQKHYLQTKGCISLRFKSSSIGEFKFERVEFKGYRIVNYEGNEFVLLEETIKINKSVLTGLKHCEQLLIPYRYYFSDSEEKLYLNEGDCYRNLIIGQYNFIELNTIQKFDMIVVPEELANEDYYLKQIDTRLSIIFNIYVPGEERLLNLSISNIKDEVQTILFSLCNGYYTKISKQLWKKIFQVIDSVEQIHSVLCHIFYIWLKCLMKTSLPFHFKFLLSFFAFENELIQPHSAELLILLFQGVNNGFILSLINSRCDAFSDYIPEIKSRPYLLHHAMQGISSKDFSQLVKFLPLYHFLFGSKEYFNIAQSNNAFLDNAYWGLPSDVKFQYSDDVDISVIRDAMSMFHSIDHLLPYSIILLTLRSDIFLKLLEIISIPFLAFFSVLLYRVKTWSLIGQDCELRELVFTTFLEKSEQTPGFMNEDHICQACDVIFRMLDVIKDSPVTLLDKLNLEQAKCTLHVLAKLLGLFDENNPTFLSRHRIHRDKSNILSLKTSPVLFITISNCLYEDVLQPNYQSKSTLFEEVTNVWNALCCMPFPQGYDWSSEVCKQLSKQLTEQTLESILTTFVEICNRHSELNTNNSIISSFRNEILETLRISEIVDKDQRTAIEHIVQVSKEKFYLVADIIAAILASNLSKINENPVKHILSLPWWSRVVKFCKPNQFAQSHPEAEKIMELVKSTFSNISLQYHILTIKTKDLTLILDNQDNYFSMLESTPEGDSRILKQLDKVIFNNSIQYRKMLRDAFKEFRVHMQDLKKLLDSTNSQIRSQELSQFLDLDFNNASISTLISENGKTRIMPDWEHSEIINSARFKLMLRTLPDLIKSQYFLSTFKQKVEGLKEFEKSLEQLHLLCIGAINTIQNTIRDLFNMKILISTVCIHFYNDTTLHSDLFDREIDYLVAAIEVFDQKPCYNKENKAESVRRVKLCFKIKQRQKLTETIIEVKDKFCINGNFDKIYILNTLSEEKKDLQSLTREMFDISNQLFMFTDLHQRILDHLLICVDLFLWTSSILKNETDLDNLRELAANSIDGSPFEVNCISSFYTLCRLYNPFIYEFNQEINLESFLLKLSEVHCNIESYVELHKDTRYRVPELYKDCASEANIEFWKTLELKHTSTGGNTISQLNQIMSVGEFLLNVKESSCSIEDIISVQITQNYKIKTYSLNELKEMQSETVLISPEMHEDSVGARFQHLLKLILSLSEIVLKFHKSENVLFRNKNLAYSCESTNIMSEDISFLEEKFKIWISTLEQARQKHYYLNFFTSSQILTIQIELERLGRFPADVMEKQAFYLLTFLSEDLSEEEVHSAFNRVERGSFSSGYSSISSIGSVTSDEMNSSSLMSMQSSLETSYFHMSIPEPINYPQFQDLPTMISPQTEYESLDESLITHTSESQLIKMYQNQREYICLTKLEKLFRTLSPKKDQEKRNFSLTSGEPNLIFVASHLIMDSILSLYYPSKQLPYPHEVLICSEKTTLEEIEIFWRRSLHKASNAFIFCLASIEKLNYDIAVKSVSSLKGFLNSVTPNKSEFRLVLICSEKHKHSNYMASALGSYERISSRIQNIENLKSFVFKTISASSDYSLKKSEHFPMKPASTVDPDECYVRIVSSESHGNGKSLAIKRWVEALKKVSKSVDPNLTLCTIVSLYKSKGCEDKAVDKLLASPVSAGGYGRIYHFDIICSSDIHLLSFLFKLLIMRTICDSSGRIYRCSKNNYYVIEANTSTLNPELMHFFDLFPVRKCLGPNEVLRYGDEKKSSKIVQIISLHDPREFQSEPFQRVFAYLEKLESRTNIDKYIYTNDPNQMYENRLDVLLKYYDLDNPSWSEVKHFISFFNKQLIACEENIYCQSVKVNKHWSGFKKFLVDCMVLMSKDFTTPSLRNSLQSPPPDAVAGYGIDENRKWGQKNYPNIFMNEDLQSMTFFGISISQDLSKLNSFDSNRVIGEKVISKQLYDLLKKNEVNLEEDFHNWDRHKMLSILVNVLGVPSNSSDAPPDPDPNYVLTVDNVKKILAIHMRFRSNIPVILMGDTGCGKTRLIKFMCKLQSRNPDLHNLVILRVHGEITENDIKDSYRNALKLAEQNSSNNIDTIIFFDEANTSYSIGLIKEMLCDRRVDGESIPNRLRLQFVVACNPYQRHSDEMLTKLTSAGLGMLASNDQVGEHFVDIPLRELVYRVLPLPNSLLPLVWDFGNLTPESEKSYIASIVDAKLKHDTCKQLVSYSRVISDTLFHSQMYMRKRRDECSFVSLRDVERTVRVMLWFYQWLPNLHIPNMTLDLITYSLILALAVCYRAKLRERKEFDEYVISNVDLLRKSIPEISLMTRDVEKFQDVVVSMMSIGEHIARNRALKENLFMMFVCIQLKIPLFIIGKPGTSKSLAKSIISHSMNGDLTIHGKKVIGIQFTQVRMQSYQCSQLTTSEEIRSLFRKCGAIQAENDPSCVACVVLDEVGLAEDSPNLPLKILHSLLEDGMDSEGQGPGVAFIGLSNWALDPAKMNRGIMLHLEDPTAEELVNTAHSIIKPCGEKHDSYSQTLSPYIKSLAEGYLKFVEMALLKNKHSKDYFGLRDFYHLIKILYFLCKTFGNILNKRIITHAIKKNFGGITDINVIEIFNQYMNIPDSEDDIGPLSDPLSLITSSLESKSHEDPYLRSRYLLLLTDDCVALDILFNSHILNEDTKVIFGSSFPLDQEYFSICHNLNRIKIFMETGKTVVLTNLSNVYECLYEMLNQFYVELFGRSWVDIGIGSRRITCAVHPDFRLIVIADKSTVFEKFPPPLINRLEKHILTISTIIQDDVVVTDIVAKLTEWLRRFDTIHINIQNDTLPFMVYSTINKLGLEGRELEWEEHILKVVKFELLKMITPFSILRLSRSDLTSDPTDICQNYCKIKLCSLVDYLREIPNIRKYFDEQYRSISERKSNRDKIDPVFHSDLNSSVNEDIPFLSFVTTHSILLTETDISEIASNLTAHFEMKPNISLINLSQFRSEKDFIFSIFQDMSIKLKENEKKIIIIQCEEHSKYSDLISCAKYRLVEIINENNSLLNSNFYFILIIKLVLTEPGSGCPSFCGAPWDSVYIDVLRKSYHYLLPPFDQITQLSVAQIFDYDYKDMPNLSSISSHGDKYFFRKKRLLRCIQKAVSRLFDPSENTNDRFTPRISRLGKLLSHQELADLTCDKISNLLSQITSTKYSAEWAYIKALEPDSSTCCINFMKTLSLYIDDLIVPLLGGILAILDTHNNLDLPFHREENVKELWRMFYRDENIINLSSLITERSLSSPYSILNHSRKIKLVKNCFPFFQIIYQQVNSLFHQMCANVGVNETFEKFEDNFNLSSIGRAVSTVNGSKTKNSLSIQEAYLKDFCTYHMSSMDGQLFQTLYIMLSVAASKHRRTRMSGSVTEDYVYRDKLPEVTIPSIHIAYHLIRRRIVFVKEVFNLGIPFPREHVINLSDWYQNPKTCFVSKDIDFMIFKRGIEECFEKIKCLKIDRPQDFYNRVDQCRNFVDNVLNYSSLIEESWDLFQNDSIEDMNTLRSKWEAAKCLALFVTNFFDEKLLGKEKIIKSTVIIQKALTNIQNIVSQENVNFRSPSTIKSILDMLKIFTSDCDLKVFGFFQDLSALFFLQMILNITFSNVLTSIREDLTDYLLEILMKDQTSKRDEKDKVSLLYLYKGKELNPSPALRCILLEIIFRHRNESIQNQIARHMKDNCLMSVDQTECAWDNLAFLLLQSLEDSYHHNLPKNKVNIGNVLSKFDISLCPISSSKFITYEIIESVAAIRFAMHWIVKWKTASHLRDNYFKIRKQGFVSENICHDIPVNDKDLNELIKRLEKIIIKDPNIQLFLSKTLYFNIGYGEMIKCKDNGKMRLFFPQNFESIQTTKKWYLDIFYGIHDTYMEIKESITTGSTKNLNQSTQRKVDEKRFQQDIIFAIFSEFVPYHLGSSIQEIFPEKKKQLKECVYNILPKEPIDLQTLAADILENNLFNLPQLKISPDTHLNTVFIAGVLCHIGVFLQLTCDNTFFKPLTLIHFNPTELQNHFFPAISEEEYRANKIKPLTIKHLTDPAEPIGNSSDPTSTSSASFHTGLEQSKMATDSPPFYSHVLCDLFSRSTISPTGIRNLTPTSVALIRTLMHSIFIWTLQSKHKEHPSEIRKLVEPINTSKITYLEYFYLHLVQDIIDITTISNNTFEEAILHVHLLIDLIIHSESASTCDGPHVTSTDLLTPTDREAWEYSFEKNYIDKMLENTERGKIRNIISKSKSDNPMLRTFYEEENETNLNSMLWRHRSIIGYEHLLQVFNCQSLHTIAKYPLLEKFLKEKNLLSATKYLPDLVNLRFQLIQKSMEYCNKTRILQLSINEFIEFIEKEETRDSANACEQLFNSFQIIWSELNHQQESNFEFTKKLIVDLIGVGNNKGLLTDLISMLVNIHNDFISEHNEYNKYFGISSRSRRSVPLSVVSPSHMINYEDHLDSLIFSNATYSFQMGEGTHIHYNFSGIQKDFATRFISSKPIITLEALDTEYPEQISMIDYFKRLKMKIPQEELPDWDTIREEVMNPVGISEVISLIEMVLKFASSTDGCFPDTKIKFYLYEVLRYPRKKNLISERANKVCCLKHLSSLWHHLSIHRAKRLVLLRQSPFPSISHIYSENLKPLDIPRLTQDITKTNVDGILTLIHDFILFNLNVSDLAVYSTNNLQEGLDNFSKGETIFISSKGKPDCSIIPDDISVSQTISVWTHIVEEARRRFN